MEAIEKYGDRVQIVGVAGLDSREPMERFVDRFDVGAIPHVADVDGSVWQHFEVFSQPSWVFVDADGTATTHVGPLFGDGLFERLDELTA